MKAAAVGGLPLLDGGRIRLDAHDRLLDDAIGREKIDRVLVTLAHLLAIGAENDGRVLLNASFWNVQNALGATLHPVWIGGVVATNVGLVELDRPVASQLQVLLLI